MKFVSQSVCPLESSKMPEVATVEIVPKSTEAQSQGTGKDTIVKKNYDQYADGKAAGVWDIFVGDRQARAKNIKSFLVDILKKNGCKRVLDAACGTGVDSIVLLEEGFEVVSVDASNHMLKSAYNERWNRRNEPAFDNWVIEQGNWLTIDEDIKPHIGEGFDAIICLGSSFSHLLDTFGDQREQKKAVRNFMNCLKPGGLLIIDHRNYDQVIKTGDTSESDYSNNVYYNATHKTPIRINTKIHYEDEKPKMITRDYLIGESNNITELNFAFHPHTLRSFSELLENEFGSNAPHTIYGDFKLLKDGDVPTYYIHQIQRTN